MTGVPLHIQVGRALWSAARACILLGGFGLIALAVLCGLIVVQGQRDDVTQTGPRVDALLVMGTTQLNGRPSPVFQARLDHALELYRRGVAPRIILTGGAAPGDLFSEAAAARDYLTAQGVSERSLLLEETSRTSYQNLKNSAKLAHTSGIVSILIVSDNFHMLRSLKMARDLGLRAYGSPTRSSPIAEDRALELQYTLREAGAYTIYLFFRR
jgi:uncharacterized SAM-binding protein YcdF (DUF218 family)